MQNRSNPSRLSVPSFSARLALAGLWSLACLVPVPDAAEPEPNTPAALYALGQKYLKGEGVLRDEAKCFELTQKAADQGHAEALAMLGYCYSVGAGVKKS